MSSKQRPPAPQNGAPRRPVASPAAPQPAIGRRAHASPAGPLAPADVLGLQYTLGNRAVTQMLGARPAAAPLAGQLQRTWVVENYNEETEEYDKTNVTTLQAFQEALKGDLRTIYSHWIEPEIVKKDTFKKGVAERIDLLINKTDLTLTGPDKQGGSVKIDNKIVAKEFPGTFSAGGWLTDYLIKHKLECDVEDPDNLAGQASDPAAVAKWINNTRLYKANSRGSYKVNNTTLQHDWAGGADNTVFYESKEQGKRAIIRAMAKHSKANKYSSYAHSAGFDFKNI